MHDKDVRRIAAQRLARMMDVDAAERKAIDAPTRQEKAKLAAAEMRQREETLSWADRQRKVNDQRIREEVAGTAPGNADRLRLLRAYDPQYVPGENESVATSGENVFGTAGAYRPIEELRAAGQMPQGTANPRSQRYRTLDEPYDEDAQLTFGALSPRLWVDPVGTHKKK